FSLKYHEFFQLHSISLAHFQSSFLHALNFDKTDVSASFSSSIDALKTRKKHSRSISSDAEKVSVKKVKLIDLSTHLSVSNIKIDFTDTSLASNETNEADLDQYNKIALIDKSNSADFSIFSKDV